MAQRGICEYDGKRLLAKYLNEYSNGKVAMHDHFVHVTKDTKLADLGKKNAWLKNTRLVVKPDQLIGKRGKNKLILLDASLAEAQKWLHDHMGKTVTIGTRTGELNTFIIEPFIPKEDEYYAAIKSAREFDTVYFSTRGGVDVEENWQYVKSLEIPVGEDFSKMDIEGKLLHDVPRERRAIVAEFLKAMFRTYVELHFTFLEINPFTFQGKAVVPLDLKSRVDDTADFAAARKWGELEFPEPFGTKSSKEEAYIKDLDSKTGASLKLTILNPEGRVWTMVAGGGASVIFTDTISDLGFAKDLANYGEYSGDPNEEFTYLYARTILDLMTRTKHPKGKVLIIGGGIANFTDVAATFKGIIRALREYKEKLKANNVKIYVRRGGPNYKEGLANMRKLSGEIGVPIDVYGPETHMTKVVPLALKGGN